MTDSPELRPLSDSEDEDKTKSKRQALDSEGESQEIEKDAEVKAAQDFVESYCQAFDSAKHAGLVDLMAPDATFDWFGQEVHDSQTLKQFMASNIPDTRHLGVKVEPCASIKTSSERKKCVIGSKRKREIPSPTNVVLVHGKLQFLRQGPRKAKKQWRWERNFKLQVSYSADTSPKQHSPGTRWQIQQVIYEKTGQCRRALFT